MVNHYEKVIFATQNEAFFKTVCEAIDWHRFGFEVVSQLATEDAVKEKIISLRPALVLLDFSLSKEGIHTILKYAYSRHADFLKAPLFVALLSAEHAAQEKEMTALEISACINYGLSGFFTVPLDIASFEAKIAEASVVTKAKKDFLTMQEKLQEERLMQKFAQMFLFGAVDDGFDASEDTNDKFKVAIVSPYLCGLMGKTQELKTAVDESFAFINHLDFPMEPDYIIIFRNESDEAVVRHIERFCRKFKKESSGSLLALGSTGEGLQGALDSYKNAQLLYSNLFFFKEPAFITQQDLSADPNVEYRLKKKMQFADVQTFFGTTQHLIQYIEIYDLQKIDHLLNEQEEWLCRSDFSVEHIKKLSMAFLMNVQKYIDIKHPEKNLEIVKAIDVIDLVYTKNYFSDIVKIVRDFVMELAEAFSANTTNSTVLKVIQYVKNNYNTDLKLETLGNLFNCNSAYLGKRFKDYTGVSFNTYIDLIRIEEAKKMLSQSDLKIYEISKLIGFSNTDYFYLKFKRHTNMTPKEYRESCGRQDEAL